MSSTKQKKPALATLFQQCLARAQATGKDRRCPLAGGAAFAVRAQQGAITVTIYRDGKPLGDVEIATFRAQFAIPANAVRFPVEGQGQRGDTHYVAWWWLAQAEQQEAA